MILRRMTLVGVAAATVALGACGGSGGNAPDYMGAVGRVRGSDAFVAVVVGDGKVDAYVCDSRAVAESFVGRAHGDRVDLRSGDGARLQATLGAHQVSGRFTALGGGSPLAFSALP